MLTPEIIIICYRNRNDYQSRLQSLDVTTMNTRSDRMKRNEMSRGMGHHQGHPWDRRVIGVADLSWHEPEDKLAANYKEKKNKFAKSQLNKKNSLGSSVGRMERIVSTRMLFIHIIYRFILYTCHRNIKLLYNEIQR